MIVVLGVFCRISGKILPKQRSHASGHERCRPCDHHRRSRSQAVATRPIKLLRQTQPWPQLYFADQEQQSQALAARDAARISTVLAVSGLREGFVADSLRAQLTVDLGSLARELGALDAPTEDVADRQRLIAAADRALAAGPAGTR